jgi:alkanesulfonate monooxygenase SsuD/methylene tetrahydromethanopterin reductase-like flavin-dependent oxidoreductase (luciferase family)
MSLPLDATLKVGIQNIHRRTEPATAPWRPTIDELVELVGLVDGCGYDSLWVGDHLAFPMSILDPLLQLAQAAVVSRRLLLGTNVYLVPLRHPGPLAKQVASLDHLCEGRLIFGAGRSGVAKTYEAYNIPYAESKERFNETLEIVRRAWTETNF